jgi:dethiobiotin synthetase
MRPRTIFITGTDTGVGKTLVTALMLVHLRQTGVRALALKPFCSGGRDDAELLHGLQDYELTIDEVNPFHFAEPLAPLVAARLHRRSVSLNAVMNKIRECQERCDVLLIEGAGGLLAPLGESPVYTALDLIAKLDCEVLVVSRNRLGTINHTLLTLDALQSDWFARLTRRKALPSAWLAKGRSLAKSQMRPRQPMPRIVLTNHQRQDSSSLSNAEILAELIGPFRLFEIPFLKGNPMKLKALKKAEKNIKITLARVVA